MMSSMRDDKGLGYVPTWNGEQNTWADYVRQCRLAYETCEKRKRKFLGPKLAMRLTNKAWEVTYDLSHANLRKGNGVKYLLNYLRERLGRTSIPDSGQKLEELFIKLRRHPGEAFATWASRVMEAYKNVQRALARVRSDAQEMEKTTRKEKTPSEGVGSVRRPDTASEPQGEPPSPSRSVRTTTSRAEQQEGGADDEVAQEREDGETGDGEQGEDPWNETWDDSWWTWGGWQWHGSSWSRPDYDTSDEEEEGDLLSWAGLESAEQEVLPSEILGWILLRRAGLPAGARLTVQAAAHNSLKFPDIEKALRDQQEELLMAEGNMHRGQGPRRTYWMEEDEQWALVMDGVIDEETVTTDKVHWVAENPMAPVYAHDMAEEEESWYDGTFEWSYWHDDGEWHAGLEDGSLIAYSDMKPWLEIENVNMVDPDLGKELYEAYSTFDSKLRTFKEARWAVHQKGKNRGFFRPKGKGKGKGKKGTKSSPPTSGPSKGTVFYGKSSGRGGSSSSSSNNPASKPGYSGCFICGDLQHDYRSCPKRSQSTGHVQKGSGKMVAMVEEVEECFMMDSENAIQPEDVTMNILAAQEAVNYSELPGQRLQYAVIDTGATETVGSLQALDVVMGLRTATFGPEQVEVDPQMQKNFKFGNAQTHRAESLVYLPQHIGQQRTALAVFALDVPNVPVLVGIKTLRRLGAQIDTVNDTIEFKGLYPGIHVPLIRGRNGHLLLNLCNDWMQPQVSQERTQFAGTVNLEEEKGVAREAAVGSNEMDSLGEKSSECKDVRMGDSTQSLGPAINPDPINPPVNSSAEAFVSKPQNSVLTLASSSELSSQSPSDSGPSFGDVNHGAQEGEDRAEGEGEESQGSRQRQVGLASGGRTEFVRSPNGRSPVPWCAPSHATRPWKQVRLERPWKVDGVPDMPSSFVVRAGGRSQGHLPVGRTIATRCQGGCGRGAGGPHHEGHWHSGSREVSDGTFGESSSREKVTPGEAGHGTEGLWQGQDRCRDDQLCSQEDPEAREWQDFGRGRGCGQLGGGNGCDMNTTSGLRSYEDCLVLSSSESVEEPLRNQTDAVENRPSRKRDTPKETQSFLRDNLEGSMDDVADALATLECSQIDLMEVCCGADSCLTACIREKGGTAERIGLQNNMDLTTNLGLSRAREFCRQVKPRNMWFSPVCGPTSQVQQINMRTEEQRVKLAKKKQKSRKMIRNCIILAEDQLGRGGHVSWEWPRGNLAWRYKEVQRFFYELEKAGLIYEAKLDGCQLGVIAPDNGLPMKKPCTIMTTDFDLGHQLDLRCSGKHKHAECLGNMRASSSAFYPPKMCRLIARHVMGNQLTGFSQNPERNMVMAYLNSRGMWT